MRFYRGLTKDGKWVYGWYYEDVQGHAYILTSEIRACAGFTEILPETVGQSTGLNDKNGKEIYEGDIVSLAHPKLVATIKYEHCSFRLMHVSGSKRRQYCGDGYSELIFRNCDIVIEIIGNVHENPELTNEEATKPTDPS